MKKFIAILLAVLMLSMSTVCFAEADTTEAEATAEFDISTWVEVDLNDIGMLFLRPDTLTVSEDPATDSENENCAWLGMNDDMTVAVYCLAANDSTLADVAASFSEEDGYTVVENGLADAGLAYDHVYVENGDDAYYCVIFQGTDGYFYDFECVAATTLGATEFGAMLGSLAPIAE